METERAEGHANCKYIEKNFKLEKYKKKEKQIFFEATMPIVHTHDLDHPFIQTFGNADCLFHFKSKFPDPNFCLDRPLRVFNPPGCSDFG